MSTPDEPKNFWHTMIPAAPGTFTLTQKGKVTVRTPVVAWCPDAENAYRAMLPMTHLGIRPKAAVEHPDGYVTDPRYSIAFADHKEWESFDADGPGEEPEIEEQDDEPGILPETEPGILPETEPGIEIEWATTPFKTASFYRYTDDDSDIDFIFEVPGGEEHNPPKQKGFISKIKRDDFIKLKKSVDVRTLDDLLSGPPPSEEDEDEDDGASLI